MSICSTRGMTGGRKTFKARPEMWNTTLAQYTSCHCKSLECLHSPVCADGVYPPCCVSAAVWACCSKCHPALHVPGSPAASESAKQTRPDTQTDPIVPSWGKAGVLREIRAYETIRNHLENSEHTYFLVLWVNLSVSLSRARAYSASMSPRRRRNSERSESCCCFTSTWESKILIWSVSWARRSDTDAGGQRWMEMERDGDRKMRREKGGQQFKCLKPWTHADMQTQSDNEDTYTQAWMSWEPQFYFRNIYLGFF